MLHFLESLYKCIQNVRFNKSLPYTVQYTTQICDAEGVDKNFVFMWLFYIYQDSVSG